jgi:hypothetical protein
VLTPTWAEPGKEGASGERPHASRSVAVGSHIGAGGMWAYLPWGQQPGLLKVEELRLTDAQRRHLLHLGLRLCRWLLALPLACCRLGGERKSV